jgi:hypothetical protein
VWIRTDFEVDSDLAWRRPQKLIECKHDLVGHAICGAAENCLPAATPLGVASKAPIASPLDRPAGCRRFLSLTIFYLFSKASRFGPASESKPMPPLCVNG